MIHDFPITIYSLFSIIIVILSVNFLGIWVGILIFLMLFSIFLVLIFITLILMKINKEKSEKNEK